MNLRTVDIIRALMLVVVLEFGLDCKAVMQAWVRFDQ